MHPRSPDLATAARSMVGTPFSHQGRLPGVGLDCGGVVIAAGRLAGLSCPEPTPDYSGMPSPGHLDTALAGFADRIGGPECLSLAEPGDIVRFSVGGLPVHLGVLTGGTPARFVHAVARSPRRVTEDQFTAEWRAAVHGVYRYRGA